MLLCPGFVDVPDRHTAQRVTRTGMDQREVEMPDEEDEPSADEEALDEPECIICCWWWLLLLL